MLYKNTSTKHTIYEYIIGKLFCATDATKLMRNEINKHSLIEKYIHAR